MKTIFYFKISFDSLLCLTLKPIFFSGNCSNNTTDCFREWFPNDFRRQTIKCPFRTEGKFRYLSVRKIFINQSFLNIASDLSPVLHSILACIPMSLCISRLVFKRLPQFFWDKYRASRNSVDWQRERLTSTVIIVIFSGNLHYWPGNSYWKLVRFELGRFKVINRSFSC